MEVTEPIQQGLDLPELALLDHNVHVDDRFGRHAGNGRAPHVFDDHHVPKELRLESSPKRREPVRPFGVVALNENNRHPGSLSRPIERWV